MSESQTPSPTSTPIVDNIIMADARAKADVIIADSKAHSASLVSDAVKTAEDLINRATKRSQELMEESEARMGKLLTDALKDVFGEHQSSGRFVDVSKIPLLCKSVIDIDANLKELKGMMNALDGRYASKLTEKIVYGLVALILVSVFGALLTLIFRQ